MKDAPKVLLEDTAYYIQNVDSGALKLVVSAVKAFARSTYQGVYVIDLFAKSVLYVSENLGKWYGRSTLELKRAGMMFYLEKIPMKERKFLREVNQKGLLFFNEQPLEERLDYVMTYDFHLTGERKPKLVNHSFTPMILTKDGKIRLALCAVSLSPRNSVGHYVMRNVGTKMRYEYDCNMHRWVKTDWKSLGEMERDVLSMSAQGYTMSDIADCLCRKVDAVKACKKKMFLKLGVRNISGALSVARSEAL